MDVNNTVAVDILIRTSIGTASNDLTKMLAAMERQIKDWVTRVNKMLGGMRMPNLSASAGFGGSASGSRGSPTGSGAAGFNSMVQAQKAALTAQEKNLKTSLDNQQRTASSHSFFSGTFWGTLAGNISSRVITSLSSIPSAVKGILDEAVKIASERNNALLGLSSVATAKGVDQSAAKAAVLNLRLVKAGIVDIGNATTGLKNLLATGFSLPQAIKLLEAFSDTAAFGKQAALDYGEAIRGATEGIKNGNSILVDNVGLTKNLSIILKEAGFAETDLMKVQGDLNVRMGLYNGLIKEAIINQGDADKLTKTYTGSTAQLNMAWQNLYASVGNVITQNPDLVNANKAVTQQLDEYTKAVNKSDSDTAKFISNATMLYAKFKVGVIGTIGSIIYTFGYAFTALAAAGAQLATAVIAPFEAVGAGINGIFTQIGNLAIDTINKVIDLATNNPVMATLLGGTVGSSLVGAQKLERFTPLEDFKFTRQAAADTASLVAQTRSLYQTAQKLQKEANSAISSLQGLSDRSKSQFGQEDELGLFHRDRFGNLTGGGATLGGGSGTGTGTGGGGTAKKAKALTGRDFKPSADALALIEAAGQLGISPLDLATIIAYETKGTFSPTIRGGAGGNYRGTIQFGREEWRKYVEPLGAAGQTFAGQMPAVVQFFRDRFAGVGRTTAGATLSDLYRTVSGGNPNVPLNARDSNGSILSHIVRMTGASKRAALEKFFGGSAGNVREATGGLDYADILEEERINRFRTVADQIKAGKFNIAPTTTNQPLSVADTTTRSERYINILREGLNLKEREAELTVRIGVTQQEIAANVESYNMSLLEATQTAKVELGAMQARLPLAEAELRLLESRTEQTGEAKDLERDINLLRMQNADAVFVQQRQANLLASERLGYEREITGLLDELATGGVNDALRLQRDYLQDILQLREREYEAVASIQRSQLEITQQTAYSANRANAQVLEFMANQNGVTETMANFKIGLIESGYDIIDKGLDAILPKMGRLTSVVKDLLSSFLRLAVNAAFRRLFGLDGATGGSGGGNGGGGRGIGGLLGQLFGAGRGGQGQGQVTTGGFNPNAPLFFGGSQTGTNPFFSGLPRIQGRTPTTFAGGIGAGGLSGQDLLDQITGVGSTANTGLGIHTGTDIASTVHTGYGKTGGISQALSSQIAFGLSGAMLGAQLGQGSGVGSVLGAAGGGIIGILGSTIGSAGGLASGGIFGSTAGIFGLSGAATFGIGLAIGGALLLGSYLFGRAARRRREKREVEKLSGDVVSRIQQLLADVKSFKIIDGASAVQQALDLRQQFSDQIANLKTKPGKALARQKLAAIDTLIRELKTEAGRADRVRDFAQQTDERLIPTFHSGGFGSFTGTGYGEQLAMVKNHEAVLRSTQIYAMGGYRKLQSIGVRGAMGSEPIYERSYGARSSVSGAGIGAGKQPNVYVVGVFDESVADDIMNRVSTLGFAQKVRFAASKNYAGMVDAIEDTMAGKTR